VKVKSQALSFTDFRAPGRIWRRGAGSLAARIDTLSGRTIARHRQVRTK
jgi:hypothetical protein